MKKQTKRRLTSNSKALSCDWQAKPSKAKKVSRKSIIYKHKGDCKWKGIKTEAYKPVKGDWGKIIRRALIGNGLKAKSHLRYFEIAPGGKSSFEKHRHEHIVIGIKGRGKVVLDNKNYSIGFLDIVYVSPNTPHQLLNPFDELFGFLCVVSAKRDKPIVLS